MNIRIETIIIKKAELMAGYNCEKCRLRGKYDKNKQSILGRLWRWHIGWCPGWKGYMASLDEKDRQFLEDRYGIKKPR
jgi:hypothetical protein